MIERFHYMSNRNENKLSKGHCFKETEANHHWIYVQPSNWKADSNHSARTEERETRTNDWTNEKKKLYVCERAYNSMTTSDKSLYITSYQRCDISRKHFTNCSFDIKQHIHRISGLYHFVITFRRLLTFGAIVGILLSKRFNSLGCCRLFCSTETIKESEKKMIMKKKKTMMRLYARYSS